MGPLFRRLLVATPMLVLLQACQKDEPKQAVRPLPVRVATVAMAPSIEQRRYTGIVRARYESNLGFRVAGKVIERRVNVGDEVKAGDILALLDATDFKLNVEAQQAELNAAISSRSQAVAAEQRFRELKDKGWVAEAALESRIAAADEARARVDRAMRTLDTQRNQAAYTELKADRDGIVSALPVEAGQVVAAGQTMARVARLDALDVVVAVPEQSLGDIKRATASAELWGDTTKQYEIKLREISAEADRVSRTFEVRFSLLDADDNVRLGKSATVILTRSEPAKLAQLPLSAVMNDAKGAMVWVVDASGEHVSRRPIVIGSFTQDTAVIAAGLQPGERVVTLGVHMLDEAATVKIVEGVALSAARDDQGHGR
ncbi:MAG: efflux RND transporter periplasmic adaptor subunit [Hyphomicrobium sp.]|nr:efflux RND transporter periplasmic adaptor subunit [Hyphomicrobium sp.]